MPQTAPNGNVASCSRCGFKHARPVGNHCKKTLNSSAPRLRDAHSSDVEVVAQSSQQLDTAANPGQAVASGASAISNSSQLAKNQQMEIQLQGQRDKVPSKSHFSHSSPKRASFHKSSKRSRKGQTVNHDSSGESYPGELGGTWQSSVHTT